MATNSSNELMKTLQKISSDAQVKIQQLSNAATEKTLAYNKEEAQSARTFNAAEALKSRNFNAAEAKKTRDWQEKMSKTAHQMEVQDLLKAGLNPVLSAGGNGAQSYTTSSASSSPASGPAASGSAFDPSGAIANITGSEIGARATGYAADTSAKATRAAASSAAAAQKYAARMNYNSALAHAAAQRYAADKQYEIQVYKTQHTPIGKFMEAVNKFFDSSTFKNLTKTILGSVSAQKFKLNNDMPFSRGNLNVAGRKFVFDKMDKFNVPVTRKNTNLFIDAYMNRDINSMKQWCSLVRKYNPVKKANKSVNNVQYSSKYQNVRMYV